LARRFPKLNLAEAVQLSKLNDAVEIKFRANRRSQKPIFHFISVSAWLVASLRKQGFGKKLLQHIEDHARLQGCHFATVHTMDWEALPFYQKLGYAIELIREGYENDS
jgi:GNAT superfamily N-acetyltransferase